MDSDLYKDLLTGIVEELVSKTDDPDLFAPGELNTGYRLALHAVLSLIEGDAKGLNVEPAEIGFGLFSPTEWLRLGPDYPR